MHGKNAADRWGELDNNRSAFLSRCEQYAAWTLPKLCLPTGYNQNNTELRHDYQSVGAQAVNHLSNKMMLALFAPSRPFFRYQADDKLVAELAEAGIEQAEVDQILSMGEKKAIAKLEGMKVRPKLYEALKHLIVTGNCLVVLGKDGMRILGLKKYVVKRNVEGKVIELMLKETVDFDELQDDAQKYLISVGCNKKKSDKVDLYRWVKFDYASGDYVMRQHVDKYQLPDNFGGKWPEKDLPYRAMAWDLADEDDYGTGLVEDYAGDFAGVSELSASEITGALAASEYRWLVNPAGMTKVEDLENSENGAALPGNDGDVSAITPNIGAQLSLVRTIAMDYIQRIGRGFLLGSAVTRDAERVTAEEIRMQANELETGLGGAYSRLAVDFQEPMAFWLTKLTGLAANGQQIVPVVITGLDALSRNGDLEALKLFLGDVAALTTLPEQTVGLLRLDNIFTQLAAGHGLNAAEVIKGKDERQADQDAAQQAEAEQTATNAAASAAAQGAAQPTE